MDLKKFINDRFEPRTASVEFPALAAYCGKDEKPLLKVRGLTAEEYYRIRNHEDYENLQKIIDGLQKKKPGDVSGGILEFFGLSLDDIPRLMKIRIRAMEYALVDDSLPAESSDRLEFILKLCSVSTADFDAAAEKVFELTGMGQAAKKKPKS